MTLSAPSTLYLPSSPARRMQLRRKLAEYEERIWQDPEAAIDTVTKLYVLYCLLESETGAIGTDDIYTAIFCAFPGLWRILEADPLIWINACRVINGYSRGEMDRLVDGTGLPDPEP